MDENASPTQDTGPVTVLTIHLNRNKKWRRWRWTVRLTPPPPFWTPHPHPYLSLMPYPPYPHSTHSTHSPFPICHWLVVGAPPLSIGSALEKASAFPLV